MPCPPAADGDHRAGRPLSSYRPAARAARPCPRRAGGRTDGRTMSSPAFEEFLARLYTDEAALSAFLSAPTEAARAAGLDHAEIAALADADQTGLVMAAASFRAKRARRRRRPPLLRWI